MSSKPAPMVDRASNLYNDPNGYELYESIRWVRYRDGQRELPPTASAQAQPEPIGAQRRRADVLNFASRVREPRGRHVYPRVHVQTHRSELIDNSSVSRFRVCEIVFGHLFLAQPGVSNSSAAERAGFRRFRH